MDTNKWVIVMEENNAKIIEKSLKDGTVMFEMRCATCNKLMVSWCGWGLSFDGPIKCCNKWLVKPLKTIVYQPIIKEVVTSEE